MPLLSLREAADMAGTSKSAMFRAIRAGRLSATRDDEGNYRVDPAEVMRAFEHKQGARTAAERSDTPSVERTDAAPDTALQVRCASLEAEVRGLREMVEELRRARDKWEAQAERLALPAPITVNPTPVTVNVPPAEQRSWWPWKRRA